MSDSSGEKTEQPTPKRLLDARKKGEVPKSAELAGALSFLASICTVLSLLEYSARQLAGFQVAVDRAFEQLNTVTLEAMVMEALRLLAMLSLPPVLVAAFVYTAALALQTGGVFSIDPIKPKFDNLSPAKGFKKTFSLKSVVNLALMLFKVLVVGAALALIWRQILPDAIRVMHAGLGGALVVARTGLLHVVLWCGGAFLALAIIDYAYQRWQFTKDKRMTLQEVRREHKESEGDPHIKSQRKRLAADNSNPLENLHYMHLASLVIKDTNERLVVFIYRPRQFKMPLFLMRGAGGNTSAEILAAARTHRVKTVIDADLVARLFPLGSPGTQLAFELAAPVFAHLGARMPQRA
jgi:type III secretion protein U